jgi:ZIP family zinc transporter
MFAVTLHNIPEGMAVGVALAEVYYGHSLMTITGALALCIGIAIQNMPEGAIVSTPLISLGTPKKKAFLYGFLSGVVEPITAGITFLIAGLVQGILPYTLSFAAGAMMYVVVDELIPESQEGDNTNLATIAFVLGFSIMMVLDVALG